MEARAHGLRGDPFLWNELREHFATTGLPATIQDFTIQVVSMFEELTDHSLFEEAPIAVERFNSGGMSSGHIDANWWKCTGIPILRTQFCSSS